MNKKNQVNWALACKYCNTIIKERWHFLGKEMKVALSCPHCKLNNEFPLLKTSDKVFLRLGFLFNPLYLPNKKYVDGAPFKWIALFYPLLFLSYLLLNIIYLPFGLIYNNILIKRSVKRFYFDNENVSTALIYYANLRKLADEGDSYAALLVGKNFLKGETYDQNYHYAKHYLELALKSYHEAGFLLGLHNFEEKHYEEAYNYFTQSKDEPNSLYYLAVIHAKGLGVSISERLAKPLFLEAREFGVDDPYDLKTLLRF